MVRTLLVSPHPSSLCLFYQKYGLVFQTVTLAYTPCYLSTNSNLCILKEPYTGNGVGGLLKLYLAEKPYKETFALEADTTSFLLCAVAALPAYAYNQQISLVNDGIIACISVIRSPSIVQARRFYRSMGRWIREKHEIGPAHYALVQGNQVFELYPTRKEASFSMELIITISLEYSSYDRIFSEGLESVHLRYPPVKKIQDLEGRHIRFIKAPPLSLT